MAHQVFVGVAEDVVVVGTVLREIQLGLFEDGHKIAEALHHVLPFAELARVVEVGEVTAGQPGIGIDQRLDDLRIDLVADIGLALEGNHVLEAGTEGDGHWWREVIRVAVLVGDVFDEQHEQDVVLVLAGIHPTAQLVARRPEGGVKVGFLDSHEQSLLM